RPPPPTVPRRHRGPPRPPRPPVPNRCGTARTPACVTLRLYGSRSAAATSWPWLLTLLGVHRTHSTPSRRRPDDEPRLADDIGHRHGPRGRVAGAQNPLDRAGRNAGAVRARVRRVRPVVAHRPHTSLRDGDRPELAAQARVHRRVGHHGGGVEVRLLQRLAV